MRVVTVGYGEPFETLLSVMRHSLRKTNPTARLDVVPVGPHVMPSGYPEHAESNVNKMRAWVHAVVSAKDGEKLLLADCDLMFLGEINSAFDQDFDVAYTVRPGKLALNAGALFVRANAKSRAFVRRWYMEATWILQQDPQRIQQEVMRFGGVSQASLMHALEGPLGATVGFASLPCSRWNSVDQTWADFDPATTRIIHVKGRLRRLVLGPTSPDQHEVLGPLMRLWRGLHEEVKTLSEGNSQ